ncbi:serine/threonine-protein kinase [Kitasatospora sp. NPDC127111]|uniref:serine/threonine-protein kinase n=1 Tax=Kitasatospora sp. NPDC127111 TaxID=3345363 RepID=UPI00363FBF26
MSRVKAPELPPLAAGTVVAPGYQVLAHLCRTGWLDLYDAWSEERDCRCVVKVLRPDRREDRRLRERLLREGRWLQAFTHPHLVRAYETIESPEPFVVLETLTGETLARVIERRRHRLAADDLAQLGLHLCSAVHYLHGQGLLHLDLKPSNVVIDCRRAKVLDLSIARPPGQGRAGVGTFCYLAPEQARGGTLTPAADVWGIGITLYEAATGDVPFDPGETVDGSHDSDGPYDAYDAYGVDGEDGVDGVDGADADDWYPQLEAPAPPVTTRRRLPPALAAAIDACLRPDPDARPTIRALTAALDAQLPQARRAIREPAA